MNVSVRTLDWFAAYFVAITFASGMGCTSALAAKSDTDDVPAPPQHKIVQGPIDRYCQRWQTQLRLAWTEKQPEFEQTHSCKVWVSKNGKIEAVESADPVFRTSAYAGPVLLAVPAVNNPPIQDSAKDYINLTVALNNDTSAIKVWGYDLDWSKFNETVAKKVRRSWAPPHSYLNTNDKTVVSCHVHHDGTVTEVALDRHVLPIVEKSMLSACEMGASAPLPDGAPEPTLVEVVFQTHTNPLVTAKAIP